jgi:uncharacterized repeat protein (TIGR03847 family)
VTVGAVGPPGARVFYIQARQADRLLSLKLEKEQVLFLAGGLSEVLADLASPGAVPDETDLELEQPVEAEWAVGSMQLAYDPTTDRVVLVAKEVGDPEEDDQGEGATVPEPPATGTATARIALTRGQAAGVIEHGKRLLRGGRPPCPLCGYPLGEDHSCPKTNGHRPPAM